MKPAAIGQGDRSQIIDQANVYSKRVIWVASLFFKNDLANTAVFAEYIFDYVESLSRWNYNVECIYSYIQAVI